MADNNDEYEFADIDALSSDALEEKDVAEPYQATTEPPKDNTVIRNAAIAVAIVIIAMVFYKIISGFVSKKTVSNSAAVISRPSQAKPFTAAPQNDAKTNPTFSQVSDNNMTTLQQKVAALETKNATMNDNITATSYQLNQINQNLAAVSQQLQNLEQTLSDTVTKLDSQSHEIEKLLVFRANVSKKLASRDKAKPKESYYIKAVIPGRAWLIAANGSTLTVSEGTNIKGYGMVKLIDSTQGRILTSSGRVIRFSQQDS